MHSLPVAFAAAFLATVATAAPVPQYLAGHQLALRDRPREPGRHALLLVSRHPTTTVGRGNASADDPVVHGGSLRLATDTGDVFDLTQRLPAAGWRYLGRRGAGEGYRYVGDKLFRSVVVKAGRASQGGGATGAAGPPQRPTLGVTSRCQACRDYRPRTDRWRWCCGRSTAPGTWGSSTSASC